MKFLLFFKLFRESYLFALNAIIVNKLRTILSLLGISIGIFAIISVFTVFDSLGNKIKDSIKTLGNNSIFIQKWPWGMSGEYPWWKYLNRPVPEYKELTEIIKRSNTIQNAAFAVTMIKTVKFQGNSTDNAVVMAVSSDYDKLSNLDIQNGRYFTENESIDGRYVALIGNSIATNLFENQDPIDKNISFLGKKFTVIACLNKVGNSIMNSTDNQIIIPVNTVRKLMNINSDMYDPFIIVKARNDVSIDEMKDEISGIMRSVRRLRPQNEDNFALNETSLLIKNFDAVFSVIGIAGWIIGSFSILVGGFGIANIMFVSVRERTNMIGIQKSLGAKRYFILFQFLFEAVFLSIFGGIIGLLLVYICSVIASNLVDFEFVLNSRNIILGISVSAIIGLVSGFVPAVIASRLDPVVAIRS